MRKFVLTHDIERLDHPKVEAIRRAMENSPEIIVMKVWFNTGTGKMVTEVEAESEEAATAAFERLELPVNQALEATELVMRARVIPVVHT
jgi:hypothetical protein